MSVAAVAAERAALAKGGLVLRTRQQWGATGRYLDARTVTTPTEAFFLHVAVVTDPGDLIGTEDQVARNIERIGWARFPNTGMSYNVLGFNSGRLYEGQPLSRRGAHTYNDMHRRVCSQPTCPNRGRPFPRGGADGWNLNYTARAFCLPQMHTVPVTDAQVEDAARWASTLILTGLARKDARWHGHRCVAQKDCPGDPAWRRLPEIQRTTDRLVAAGLPRPKPLPPEDDLPTPADVWRTDGIIPAPSSEKDPKNTHWLPATYALRGYERLLEIRAEQAAQAKRLAAIEAALVALKKPAG